MCLFLAQTKINVPQSKKPAFTKEHENDWGCASLCSKTTRGLLL